MLKNRKLPDEDVILETMPTQIFQYKSLKEGEAKGIYINLKGKEHLVFPWVLYVKLWDGYKRELLCKDVEVQIQIFPREVWVQYFDYSIGYYHISYKKEDFINSAMSALQMFCEDLISNTPTIYKDRQLCDMYGEEMKIGLKAMRFPRNSSQLMSSDIVIDEFKFEFTDLYKNDTDFDISIGDKYYPTSLSDWSNDLDIIRHQLEGIVLCGEGKVELYFEDSPNTILVQSVYVHDTRDTSLIKVTITPDEFVPAPTIFGYCKKKQFVRTLYHELISLFSSEVQGEDTPDDIERWDEYRSECISKLCSHVIDDYLNQD